MTADPNVVRLAQRITDAYRQWENGNGTSPSASDLVAYAADVYGCTVDYTGGRDLADEVYERQTHGATTYELATFLGRVMDQEQSQ